MGVDFPDGSKLSIIRGWDGTQFRNIRVADTGEMYILVSALTDSALIPLQADSLGNLLLNIKAQDLAEVINRPKYGAGQSVEASVECSNGVEKTLFTVSGKGVVYGGWITVNGNISLTGSILKYYIDGQLLLWTTFNRLLVDVGALQYGQPFYLGNYDVENVMYTVLLSAGITFETSFSCRFTSVNVLSVAYYNVQFALV